MVELTVTATGSSPTAISIGGLASAWFVKAKLTRDNAVNMASVPPVCASCSSCDRCRSP